MRAALANIDNEPQQWREATEVCQNRLWLTAEEAQEIGEQIRELFLTRAQERQDPANRPPDARVMAMMAWVVPSGPAASASSAEPASDADGVA